jgi:hypothetical protein
MTDFTRTTTLRPESTLSVPTSPTPEADSDVSRTATLCDLEAYAKKIEKDENEVGEKTMPPPSPSTATPTMTATPTPTKTAKPQFSEGRKWALLGMFSLSLFIDSK